MNTTANQALANTFIMYFKAQSYHWNIEGVHFPQLHSFFGDIYEDVYGAVDTMAEEIRALGDYAPRNLDEIYKNKTIDAENVGTDARTMLADLLVANNEMLNVLNKLFDELTAAKKQGFADFIASRIDAHNKHGWMLKSTLKGTGE